MISPFLAYFLGKRLAGSPPDTGAMHQMAAFQAMRDALLDGREVDPDMMNALSELYRAAQEQPEQFSALPPDLQEMARLAYGEKDVLADDRYDLK